MPNRRHALALPVLALASALLTAPPAAAAGPSARVDVTGAVLAPASYTAASITALASVVQSDSFLAGTAAQTHVYTGVSLWGLLSASTLALDPAVKNDVLNKYVLATGSDGYQVVYSLGELSPTFGNRPDLVAYSETINGTPTPLGADGFARTTAPGDVKGGRYVSNLVDLDVRGSGSTQTGVVGGGVSTSFSVGGAVKQTMSFDLTALHGLTPVSQVVKGVTYTGVSFWDLLSTTVGLALNPAVKNDVLGKYVVATGSDGYKSVFSLGELSSEFGNQSDLIAFEANGQPLGGNGFARLVVPGDVAAGRWVSNLVSLEVFSAAPPIPEPAAWALMACGMILVGARAARRTSRAV